MKRMRLALKCMYPIHNVFCVIWINCWCLNLFPQVIVADNYFTGSKDNLKKWIGHPRFELIRHGTVSKLSCCCYWEWNIPAFCSHHLYLALGLTDVTEPLLIEVDQIYHLACPASPIFYKYNPVKTIKTNVIGTLNMLGLAKRVGARFANCFLVYTLLLLIFTFVTN